MTLLNPHTINKMTIQNPHHATGVQKLNTFKEIITSLDGWKFVSDKDGVKTHTMTDSTGFDLIRGDYLLKGTQYTAKQVANIPNTFGTKTVCKYIHHNYV